MSTDTRPALIAERRGYPAAADLLQRRQAMANAAAVGNWRTDPCAHEENIAGVRTLCFRPAMPARAIMLHLHGGAFRLGHPEMIGPYAAALADRCAIEVWCPAYRLAPEYPMPAALIDASRVLAELRQRGNGPLFLAGDSAGGGLAASVTVLDVAQGNWLAGLVLLSPWLDLTVTSECYEINAASDPLFSRAAATEAAELYLQGMSPRDPLASPLFSNLSGFPPTLISVGKGEVLADDGHRFYAALQAAEIEAKLSAIADMQHVAVTRGLTQPGAKETFNAVAEFIDLQLRKRG